MAELNPQAVEANNIIKKSSPVVYDLLSKKGRAIYYPSKGILAQGAAAKGKEINATIGTAYEDDGAPMVLPGLANLLKIDNDLLRIIFQYIAGHFFHRGLHLFDTAYTRGIEDDNRRIIIGGYFYRLLLFHSTPRSACTRPLKHPFAIIIICIKLYQ